MGKLPDFYIGKSMSVESILSFIIASSLISIAPGPDNLFVLTQSALYGRRSGVIVTLGLCTGLTFHTTAVALGLAVVFQESALAFTLLKIIGSAYLLYLAWQAFSARPPAPDTDCVSSVSAKALYLRGIIMSVTNPKLSIFFLAFLPQFVSLQNGNLMIQFFVLGGLFIITGLVIFCVIVFLSGSLSGFFQQSPKSYRYLNYMAGSVFVILAYKLISSSFNP